MILRACSYVDIPERYFILFPCQRPKAESFILKDTIGEDGWKKMNAVLENRLNKTSEPNAQATLAELRGYLDGHKDLQDRFDAMFNHINDGTMATVKNWSAKPEA